MENKTIYYFKEISKIPRESYNEKEIANYIVNFAKERNLDYIIDEHNNVIVKKYISGKEPVILQAHIDMVCEKEEDKVFNFKTDSIEVIEKDGYLMANGTTLGADNGVGVAQILNLLDTSNFSIEAIFTTDEEVNMTGVQNIDVSSLKGKVMINLDGFEKDTILLGCASFTDTYIHMNYTFTNDTGNFYKIILTGFEGGHSGSMIDKHLGNSNVLLAKLLLEINDIKVSKFTGGNKLNVIPTYTEAIIKTNLDINSYVTKFINENSLNYPGLVINVEAVTGSNRILTLEDSKLFLDSVANFKNGVINKNNRGEVTTSENLGIVNLSDNILGIGLRSSIEEERLVILDYFNDYCNKYNYKLDIIGYQPGFTTSEDSLLVKDLIKAYKEFNNSEPNLKSVHIGLEVAFFKKYIKDLEAVVISSDIIDPHAPSERVSIESIKRCDEWLQRYLINKQWKY